MPLQDTNRPQIFRWICDQTPENARVLDIGCGAGELLALLATERKAVGTGIELDEECVVQAVQRGLSVHHGNAEEGMDHYADNSFDVLVLSLAIQEMKDPLGVIREAFRIGKRVVIVFPNFGYWRARWHLGIRGRAPLTMGLPNKWYESPNRHYFTVADWEELCYQERWRWVSRGFLAEGRWIRLLPNLFSEIALYAMED